MIFDRKKQRITIHGVTYSSSEIKDKVALNQFSDLEKHEELYLAFVDLFNFLADWFSDSSSLIVHTSGSTGKPKELTVSKDRMMQSARLTCEYLHLHVGDKALLCMNLRYIGAKMVVVRALVAGLDLIVRHPSGHPLADVPDKLCFAAMVPLQVYQSFYSQEETERLRRTEILIIGGGSIDAALESKIKEFPNEVYSTYGMTETLSHIALRRLNGPCASFHYHPFPSVSLSLSAENALVIDAPLICKEKLVTNDIAKLFSDGSFVILGRKDNIINSGGIKIQAEWVEQQLKPFISVPFVITSIPDVRLGEAIVLLITQITDDELADVRKKSVSLLSPYNRPKKYFRVDGIPLTDSGKVDRRACRNLVAELQ